RSDEEVRAFSQECLDVLVERDVKGIVVACNTSTAVALGHLRRRYDLPILGVIRPGASAAALATRSRRVGVIATPATVRSHAYFHAIKEENPAIEVYEHATPSLVPLVEAGEVSGPAAARAVDEALAPLLGTRDGTGDFIFPLPASARIDTLLLGCTHYPLLRPLLADATGDHVAIVDWGCCAGARAQGGTARAPGVDRLAAGRGRRRESPPIGARNALAGGAARRRAGLRSGDGARRAGADIRARLGAAGGRRALG